jgi:hypothetical protein
MASVADVLLTDLAHKRDFLPTPGGDLQTISGMQNVRDALFARLMTEPGSLIHRPDYGVGIKRFQNALNRLGKQRELAGRISENFARDPRVEKVEGVLVDYDESNPSKVTIVVRVKVVGVDAVVMNFTPFSGA